MVFEIPYDHPMTDWDSGSEADALVNHLNEDRQIPDKCKLYFPC